MLKAPTPVHEDERLKTLEFYNLLDTGDDPYLDEITKTASLIFNCKITLVSLIDRNRQWFKSCVGLNVRETPRDVSFCGHAIMGTELFIVEDALNDERFCDNPLTTGGPQVRFYAGAPLIMQNGHCIGTLCIIDSEAKKISEKEKLILKNLSKQVSNYLELRKQSDDLYLNKTKMSSVLGNILEGMVIQDSEGKIIEYNQASLNVLDLTENQLRGRDSFDPNWRAIKVDGSPFPGEEHPAMITLKTGKKVENVIMGINTPTKGLRWIKINSSPLLTSQGMNALTTFQDITPQKELEIDLLDLNQYLDLALEGAGLGIWDWNLVNNSVRFDQRWAKMLGYNIDEIEMNFSTWETRVHPDDLERSFKLINSYLEGKVDFYENIHRLKHKHGHWVYVLARGRFSKWDDKGKPVRFTGTHLDITEAKRSQEEQMNEFNEILSSTPSCLKVITKEGILLEMNSQGLALVEADNLESVIGANIYDLIEKSHLDKFIAFNKKICAGEKGSLVFEIIGLKGTRKWMETYAAPYRMPNGEFAHIAITNEITEKVLAEKEYVRQKTIALHHAKLASIGELAAGVGHEINNPLAIIKGYITAIKRKLTNADQLELTTFLESIKKMDVAADRISKIVQGLRTFSRSDSNEVSDFCPLESVEESYHMIQEIFASDGVDISVNNMIHEPIMIKGDRGKFQQVVMNLISNAKDASAGKAEKLIKINMEIKENHFVFSIQDNGCGIPSHLHEKIFEPFFTTKEVHKGTGIGLSLVHNFLQEMGGTISLTSVEGEGATFFVTLPLAVKRQDIQGQNPVQLLNRKYSGNVLLVDDEEGIRSIISETLHYLGLNVVCAVNGRKALEVYNQVQGNFDLIISDVKMPEMDGIELLKKIKEGPYANKSKFIFISGGIQMNFEEEKLEFNKMHDGFLYKPFEDKNLIGLLDKFFHTATV